MARTEQKEKKVPAVTTKRSISREEMCRAYGGVILPKGPFSPA